MTFSALGLSEEVLKAVAEQGYDTPTPIQERAIPAVLAGRDILAAAQTGTGKTAGFALPILDLLTPGGTGRGPTPRALVVTPTRELAAQIEVSFAEYGKFLPLKSQVVFGGVRINAQIGRLKRGVDILVATPGRLLDLHGQGALDLGFIEILVLDEADRMLDMGFIRDIRKILRLLPKDRQNLLFSATFAKEIRTLTGELLNNPVSIDATPRNEAAVTVEQSVHLVEKRAKTEVLARLINEKNWEQVLVFTRTKHGANRLAQKLERAHIKAAAIHGNKSQGARTRALAQFKAKEVRVLVATDIASRGIDIDQLPQVVNFELPQVPEDYVHRIGRTGRAGLKGFALSLVSADEAKLLRAIERLIKRQLPTEGSFGDDEGRVAQPRSAPRHRSSRARNPQNSNARSGAPKGRRTQRSARPR